VTVAARPVLLVEDEALIAAVAADILDELGYSVVEVGSAKAAMDFAQTRIDDVQVAIVDLGLPDRKGDELVSDLRAMRADLPVVIATGYGSDAVRSRLKGAEGIVILTKPYDISHLRAALGALKLPCTPNGGPGGVVAERH
jgi:DNA-binding response OmpR family regulator